MTPKFHFCASVVNKHIVLLTRQTDKQSRKQGKRVRSQDSPVMQQILRAKVSTETCRQACVQKQAVSPAWRAVLQAQVNWAEIKTEQKRLRHGTTRLD